MKISKVSVKKLFGVFDHTIKLNKDSGVTIVIGENGLGKTVILESINALFEGSYKFFTSLDFEDFSFHFDNREVWHLSKKSGDESTSIFAARYHPEKTGSKIRAEKIYTEEKHRSRTNRWYELERDMLLSSAITSSDATKDTYLRKYLELERFEHLSKRIHSIPTEAKPPKWFTDGVAAVNVRLIETQRIIATKESGGESYVSAVASCANELKESISKAIKASADITSALDSTYPNRVVEKVRQRAEHTYDELNDALLKLDERRKNLSSAGLVIDAQESDLAKIEKDQHALIVILKLYIDDSHDKLNPYEDIYRKIRLFMGIINKRFKHKRLEINKDKGFVFRSTVAHGESGYLEIPPSKLSSGEQHELVLFYKLIFNSSSGDLILIDEPELSLHISWQNKFINDLKEVASMNGFSAIIATHSPDIISENWDLKVELVGIE